MKPIFASLLLLGLGLAACGGSPLDPGAGSQTGGGTNTLLVNGTASATPRITNALAATDFNTEFNVRVSLNNVPVTTGTVTMKSTFVSVVLTWQDNGNNTGHWQGTAAGYDQAYQLDVTSGADSVTGVIVDGPDIHAITAPTAGASLDSTMPITTTWNRANAADEARVAATGDGGGDGIVVPDTGSYAIAPGTLHADKAQSRTNTLRITRTNRVTPAFAVTGSLVSVSVANEVDVVALPCPSC